MGRPVSMANTFNWTATEKLYLDASGKVVGAKDPTRYTLLILPGQSMPRWRAESLGLVAPLPERIITANIAEREEAIASNVDTGPELPPRRKRGRPPKAAVIIEEVATDAVSS